MKKIKFQADMLQTISYALQYHYIPFIQRVLIYNEEEENLEQVVLKVSMESDIADDFTAEIGTIEAKSGLQINRPFLPLSFEKLHVLNEKTLTNLTFTLSDADEVLYEEKHAIEILPYDHWLGMGILPELICSFVTPNQPAVTQMVVKASQELEKITGSSAFTGYMSQSPNQVMAQLQALYNTVWKHHIIYSPAPASFERYGQRVRMPKEVLNSNIGNCIEMSCLFASLMEAVHLHPLIVMIHGHAYVGCWTKEETFSEIIVDDLATIQKFSAQGIHDIVLFECTASNADQFVPFDQALKSGVANLERGFEMVIDVKRSRGSGIHPFPETREELNQVQTLEARSDEIKDENVELQIAQHIAQGVKVELTRVQTWERKLLDMSLRNPLISVRLNKNALQLMVTDLDKIEDELYGGKEFQILGAPEDSNLKHADRQLYDTETNADYITQLMKSEFKSKRMRSFYDAQDTELVLRNLYRASRLSIEENGTNTLYLALGFLKWYENDISEKERYAPLLLVPVELIRKSAKTGYVIRERDEDVLFNETLLEMLKQDFKLEVNGLSTLPLDDKGVDVNLVFNIVRQAIKDQKRWNVVELAMIGLFSFKQFVMWNDLRNRKDDLASNKVVKSLMDGRISWEVEDVLKDVDLDDAYKPSDLALPVDVDSSQLSAVCLADKGQSFILHGPPGTGKSQTITNMIANALYHNKSVLFIAEKSAALNVVRKRLEKIGLGPFCLELHSDKARKRDVLSQLDQTLELGQLQYPETYAQKAEELYGLRQKLDTLMQAIHHKTSYGKSLYEYMNRAEELRKVRDVELFHYQDLSRLNETQIEQMSKALHDYCVSARQIDAADHPLKDIQLKTYTMEVRERLDQLSHQILNELTQLVNKGDFYTLMDACENEAQVNQILQVIAIYESSCKDARLFDFDAMDTHAYAISQWTNTYKEIKALEQELSALFHMEASIPYAKLEADYKSASSSFFLLRGSKEKQVLKDMQAYAKNPSMIVKDKIPYYCGRLRALDEKKTAAASQAGSFASVYGKWMENPDALQEVLAAQKRLKDAWMACPRREEVKNFLINKTEDYTEAMTPLMKMVKEESNWVSYQPQARYLAGIEQLNLCLSDNISALREYALYSDARSVVHGYGLKTLTDGYEAGIYDLNELNDMFDKSLTMFLIEYLMSEKDEIMKFTYESMCDTLKQYRELTTYFQQLTKEELAARLSSNIPNVMNLSSTSEIAILKRAIKSNGRAMSIRKLFDSIPNLLRKLTPCMLMSPMSVAQYIDPKYPKFDLVIFDEASQLPTSSAVGAIARGENLIVVGDPKQMPPTSFFQAANVDEENLDKEDLESILDDCLSLSMPQLYLSWHYRSQHESLISFSNMQFYENRLMTFPSVANQKSMVKFVEVKGTYRKGKNRVNLEEAKAIVAEIKRRLFDDALRNQSIGVVTFNVTQQLLIDDLLMEAFREDKEFEERANALYEPIFIKNLENVQGDERDVILFSICYGPDEDGRVSMNFGPINRDGGERRLNVAVSRSRMEMVVFSTLLPHQIDLNRTRSRGAAELKAFLEYAMNGRINAAVNNAVVSKDDYVLKIAEELRTHGYDVNTFVGSSRFKVDIAIKDPDHPEEYLVGIMVDGVQYANAKTTRDRSVSQISVLKRLGWNIMELFVLDWWEHREDVLKRLAELMETSKQKKLAPPEEKPAEPVKKEGFVFKKVDVPVQEKVYPVYKKAKLKACDGGAEAASLPENKSKIIKQMTEVIDVEAPIVEEELFHRVMSAWGVSRIGPRLKKVLSDCAASIDYRDNLTMSPYTKKVFYWGTLSSSSYEIFRTPTDEVRRGLDQIAYEEIINAAKEVLMLQLSMQVDDLKRETAKMFGWSKVTSASTGILDHAIEMMVKKNIAVIADGKINLK